MKRLLILGAGSAGTMMANHLVRHLAPQEWELTVVDQEKVHYYQPGFLFLPFNRPHAFEKGELRIRIVVRRSSDRHQQQKNP